MKRGNLNIVSDKESDTIDIADIDLDLKENNFLKVRSEEHTSELQSLL